MKSIDVNLQASKVIYSKLVAEAVEKVGQATLNATWKEYTLLLNSLKSKMLKLGVSELEYESSLLKMGLYAAEKAIPANQVVREFNCWTFPLVLGLNEELSQNVASRMKKIFDIPTRQELIQMAMKNPLLAQFGPAHLQQGADRALEIVANQDLMIKGFVEALNEFFNENDPNASMKLGLFLFIGYLLHDTYTPNLRNV